MDITEQQQFKENVSKLLDLSLKQMEILFNAFVNENFLDGKGTKKKLAIRTGKLARSLIRGKEGNITKVSATDYSRTIEIGTNLNYGLYWENGFEAYKVKYTQKMLGFLFSKWKAEGTLQAKKKGGSDGYFHHKKENARPFLSPANLKFEREGIALIEAFFIKEFNKLYS